MKALLALCFCLIFLPVQSQILNIDKTDTSVYSRHSKINLLINSGLEIDKQKATLYDASNTMETMWQEYKELFILAGSYRLTYNGPDDILNAGYIHLRYRHGYKNKFQPEPFVQYQWDSERGISHRFLSGMNLRYNLLKGNSFDLNAGLGLMYENEEWNYVAVDSSKIPPGARPIITRFAKINSYLRFDWKTSKNSSITFSSFLQTRPAKFWPRVAPQIQWDIKAGKHIGFSVGFSGLYDTHPIVPIERFYYSLTNSLQLSF